MRTFCRFFFLLALALGAFLPAGCDFGPAPATPVAPVPSPPSSGQTATTPAAPVASPPLQVGSQRSQTIGSWTFGPASSKFYQFLPAANGAAVLTPTLGVYVGALLNITNAGPAGAHLALTDFQLADSAGHTYAPDAEATRRYIGDKGSLAAPDAPIAPGATARVGIIFNHPLGDARLTLIVLQQARLDLGPLQP